MQKGNCWFLNLSKLDWLDGRILFGASPVMSYYEFKQPINDRLTDEKWIDLLKENPPKKPSLADSFTS